MKKDAKPEREIGIDELLAEEDSSDSADNIASVGGGNAGRYASNYAASKVDYKNYKNQIQQSVAAQPPEVKSDGVGSDLGEIDIDQLDREMN